MKLNSTKVANKGRHKVHNNLKMTSTTHCSSKICSRKNTFYTVAHCECILCLECRIRHKLLISLNKISLDKQFDCQTCGQLINKIYVSSEQRLYSEFRPRNSVYDKTNGLHIARECEDEVRGEISKLQQNLNKQQIIEEFEEPTAIEKNEIESTIIKKPINSNNQVKTNENYRPHSKKYSTAMNNKSSLRSTHFPQLSSSNWNKTQKFSEFTHASLIKKSGPLDQFMKTGFEIKTRKMK